MKITHLASACNIIQHGNIKILSDPWLVEKAFYGSWTHYPPLDIDFSMLEDIDYIYISHIHPDHMCRETLDKINPDIPVLIHNYDAKFVKDNLEHWGRKVIELEHGEKFHCGEGLNIYIYAADNCDPSLCFKFLGCGKMESKFGSTSIDTMAVFENEKNSILNVNDCPYELSRTVLNRILKKHFDITMLLVGYTGAGSYPQCWKNYSDEDKINIYGKRKKDKFLKMGVDYINHVTPKYYMPFAGTYVFQGPLVKLEKFKCAPELEEALEYYKSKVDLSTGILLNINEYFDLEKCRQSRKYIPIDKEQKEKYMNNVLVHRKYDFDFDDEVILQNLLKLVPRAYERFDNKRAELNFSSDINIYLDLVDNKLLKISCCGDGYEVLDKKDFYDENYVSYTVEVKLLHRILKGPKYAHWNNAEIGSHITFSRDPDIYNRALHFCMNYFHS